MSCRGCARRSKASQVVERDALDETPLILSTCWAIRLGVVQAIAGKNFFCAAIADRVLNVYSMSVHINALEAFCRREVMF